MSKETVTEEMKDLMIDLGTATANYVLQKAAILERLSQLQIELGQINAQEAQEREVRKAAAKATYTEEK